MYECEQSKAVLNSEVRKHGKRRIRCMLERQGYSRADVLTLVPVKIKRGRNGK